MAVYLVLPEGVVLRRLESPAVYDCRTDTLFEIDEDAFEFLRRCGEAGVPEGDARDTGFVRYCIDEGLLEVRPSQPVTRNLPVNDAPLPSLRYLELQVTSRCNLRCRHCYLGPARGVDLSLEEIQSVIRQFERLQGLRLLVSGGEPLLHPDFDGVNGLLRDSELRVVLLSNGTLIDDKRARDLSVQEVQLSIDGMKAGHEALRGPASFERVVAALRRLQDAGKAVSVATMVHAANVNEFDELARFLKERDVVEWSVDAPCESGNLTGTSGLMVPPSVAGRLLSYGFGGSLHEGESGATCGSHLMAVTPDGMGCKCGYYSERPVGHIREGLAVLWDRIPRPDVTDLTCSCAYRDACRGGCRFRAEACGDPLGPDPVKCAEYGVPGA